MNEQNFYAETPWTWRERLRFRLFPSRYCELPVAPATYADVVVVKTVVVLSFTDRLRTLLSGRVTVETRTVCENVVGATITSSVGYPSLP